MEREARRRRKRYKNQATRTGALKKRQSVQ
jgi:hypothetical protein